MTSAVNRMQANLHQSMEKLLLSEERYRSVVATAYDGFWVTDGTGRLIEVNNAYVLRSGYNRAELLSMKVPDLDIHDDEVLVAARIQRLQLSGSELFISQHRTKSGEAWDVEVSISYVEIEGGIIFCFLRDISKRKAMESQLLQAQKMETVGLLTGGVAHDFNNLLQIVQGNLEIAKNTIPEGSKADELVNGALRAGHRGARLTQQLLAFSRKQTLNPENLDARSLVDGMSSLLARTLGEDISVKTEFADGVANIMVDENGLTNALLNLAINARAAMPKGGTLTVAVGQRYFGTDVPFETDVLSSGDYVEIAVTDTGCGMSGENLGHAFEPFFTTKEIGEGSGLGLSMVYGFTRQSGGIAIIESKVGKGTTVRLVLPATTDEPVSTSDAQTTLKDAQLAIKVLLVEDDADVRASTVMLLEALGCEVIEAERAAPVPDILRQDDSIELLISDVVLPGGKNGIELAEEAVRLHPALKVILVSGHAEGMLEKAGLKDAGFRLLGKPYTREALSETLGSVMAQ